MPRLRTSRRVPPLKDSDYDHEICLVDEELLESESSRQRSGTGFPIHISETSPSHTGVAIESIKSNSQSSRQQATLQIDQGGEQDQERESEPFASHSALENVSSTVPILHQTPPTPGSQSLIQSSVSASIARRPSQHSQGCHRHASTASKTSADSALDIMYENERGGILCGLPLFSSKALGNIDPTPWTNIAHKPSPTDVKNATVPDPSWEWSWPEWKINHGDGVDKDGWEYSFMFSKKFSWHGPKWWNSFVRRRAWVRRRVRRRHREGFDSHAAHDSRILNTDYFTVRPASAMVSSRRSSMASRISRVNSLRESRASIVVSACSRSELDTVPDLTTIEMLLAALKSSRIDREKIEAIENYLSCAEDGLVCLQEAMHSIMALFIFQSSRRILLARLMNYFDELLAKQEQNDSPGLQKKKNNLSEAIKHADEEVRKLEYWSDIKGMAERGESHGAVDSAEGWDDRFQGVDNSSPAPPSKPKPDGHETQISMPQ